MSIFSLELIEYNCYYEKFGCSSAKLLENIPFELPNGWIWIRQSNLCWLDNGNKTQSGELPYLEAKVIRQNKPDKYQTSGVVVDSNFKLILVAGENSGEIFTPPFQGYMGSTFKILDVTLEIDFQYLLLIFELNLDLYRNSKTGAAIPHLNKKLFKENLIALPPLNEQQRIVKKLSEFDPLLERYQNIEKELSSCESTFEEKLKASILQYAIEGKLVKQDPNDEPASVLLERIKAEKEKLIQEGKIKRDKNDSQIPLGDDKNYYQNQWVYAKLKSFLIPNKNGLPATKYIKYIDIDSIDNKKHVIKSYKLIKAETATPRARRILMEGDILYSIVRPYLENIAKVTKDYSNCIGSTGFYICRPIKYLTTDFLFIILLSPYFKSKVMPHMKGDNSPSITSKVLEEIQIAIPSLAQQKKINLKVAEIMSILG